MTEFEILTLWYQIIELANSSITNFLTVLLAMFAVSHFVADKLHRAAAITLLVLFTLFSAGMINEIYSTYRDFADLALEIQRISQQPGTSITWHALARGSVPPTFVPTVVVIMCSGAYVAAVSFFVYSRRSKRGSATNDT